MYPRLEYAALRDTVHSVVNMFNPQYPTNENFENLAIMIMAHESHLHHIVQDNDNLANERKALGLSQMEPLTGYRGVLEYLDRKPKLQNHVSKILGFKPEVRHAQLLAFDLRFTIVCMRVFFWSKPEAIPKETDKLSLYAKKYWNTEKGKAKPEDYLSAYHEVRRRGFSGSTARKTL